MQSIIEKKIHNKTWNKSKITKQMDVEHKESCNKKTNKNIDSIGRRKKGGCNERET